MSVSGSYVVAIKAVDQASGAFGKIQASMGLLGGQLQQLGAGFEQVGSIIGGFAAAGVIGAAVAAFGELIEAGQNAIQTFQTFEETVAKIVAATGLSGEAAEQLSQQLEEAANVLGPQFGFTATEAAQALEALVKAGLEGEDAVTALTSTLMLATIEGAATADMADLLVQTMGMFSMSAEEAERATDALVNASRIGVGTAQGFANGLEYAGASAYTFGISMEETLGALVAMNNQGLQAEKAGRYLDAMFTDLIQNSEKMGITIYDLNGQMLPLADIMAEVENKMATFGSQAERDAWVVQNFSRQSARAVLMLTKENAEGEKGSAVLKEYGVEIGRANIAMQASEMQLDTLAGEQAKANAEWDRANQTIGRELAPAMTTFYQTSQDVANVITTLVTPLVNLGSAIVGLGAALIGYEIDDEQIENTEDLAEAAHNLANGINKAADAIRNITTAWKESIFGYITGLSPWEEKTPYEWERMMDFPIRGKISPPTLEPEWADTLKDGMLEPFEETEEELIGHSLWPEMWKKIYDIAMEKIMKLAADLQMRIRGFTDIFRNLYASFGTEIIMEGLTTRLTESGIFEKFNLEELLQFEGAETVINSLRNFVIEVKLLLESFAGEPSDAINTFLDKIRDVLIELKLLIQTFGDVGAAFIPDWLTQLRELIWGTERKGIGGETIMPSNAVRTLNLNITVSGTTKTDLEFAYEVSKELGNLDQLAALSQKEWY